MTSMRYVTTLVTLLLLTLRVQAAASALNGEVFVAAGTTGTNAIPSSRTTNVTISATSKVTDGASAVAFSLNSSNALSTSGAKLLTVGNGGTNVAYHHLGGGLIIGKGVDVWYGPDEQDLLVGSWDKSLGEPVTGKIYLSAVDDGNTPSIYGDLSWRGSANNGTSRLIGTGSNGTTDSFTLNADPVNPGATRINLSIAGASMLNLAPSESDGTTPYTLDTSLAQTSGNLAEFKNNGTNYFNLEADQASTNTPITININGTLKRVHVGAPDSGGTGLRALTVVN